MMKRYFLLLMCLAALMLGSMETMAKKVWMLGDSTMTEYDESEPTGGRGWGMYFGNFLINGWTSVNMAKGGRDSRGGYNELWQNCKNDVEPGDYVIIQFAHNDASCGGIDYLELKEFYKDDPEKQAEATAKGRGTNPQTTYKEMLKKLCDEVKEKGATPILVSAVCRCQFTNGKMRRSGRHDIGGNYEALVENTQGVVEHKTGLSLPESDHSYDYPYQMKQVADAEGVLFVDMTTATANLYESYEAQGDGNCFNVLFDKKIEANDGTHYNLTGALSAARLCAQLFQEQGILGDNIYVPTDMSFNPSTANMGEVYVGQAATKEITLSALGLSPAEGTVSITASDGILLSYDKQNWDTQLSTDYEMGTLIKTFYAKVAVTAVGQFNGTVTATLGDKSVSVPVTVSGIELGGGDLFTATWAMTANGQPTTTEGVSVYAADILFSQLEAKGYDSSNGVQIAETGATGAWAAARIDRITNQYVEFSVAAPQGRKLDINRIAMKLKAQGGGSVQCHIYYSTDDFATETQYYNNTGALPDAWKELDKGVNVKLEEGETLKIRVFPWSGEVATGNWLCIKDVVIGGQSKDAAGVMIEGSVTYTLDKGGLNQGDDAVMSPSELSAGIVMKKWTAGGAIDVSGTTNYQGAEGETIIVQTKIVAPSGTSSSAGKDNTLTLMLTPDDGYKFVPTKISFQAARYGTDGGNIGLSVAAGEDEQVLLENANVNRSSRSLTIASFTEEVTTSITATTDNPLKVNFSFVGMGSGRTMGLSNVVIEGTLVGAPAQVTKYMLTTAVVPAEAGTITRDPDLEMYKENSQVTLTATANMGYQFKEWQDATGNVVSTEAVTVVTMDGAKTMKAVFETTFVGVTLPNNGEVIDLNLATLSNGVVKTVNGVQQFDSFRNPGSATFTLNNTKAGAAYTISLGAATANAGNTLRLVITDKATSNVEMDQTIDVAANGWQNFSTYNANTNTMTQGEKTFVINFLSGGGYTSNVNNISFTEASAGGGAVLTTTVSPSGAGKVTTNPEGSSFEPGSEVTLTATANRGYEFIKWTDADGNDLSVANPYTFIIEASTSVTAVFAQAEVLNVIPTTEENPWVMENGTITSNRGNFSSDHHIDYMMNNEYVTYRLSNQVDASYYTIDFTAGTKQNDVSLNFNIKSDDGTVVCDENIDIENNGNWDSASKSYSLRTGEMANGKYTMVITFKSVGGNGTTANVNNISFTAKEKGGEELRKCILTATLDDETAGTLTVTPNGDLYEGDKVTLTVTENFGYHFAAWTDANGNVVSTDNPYSFTINEDTQLTGTFNAVNTYALNLTLTEGAQPNLVQIQPEGTMVNGKRMYEEGDEVKLTAVNNKILTFTGWEDNSTDAERTIKMEAEQNVTANFSAVDYIVGWDLYYDEPGSNRVADYKSDSENAGMLSLRNADGATVGWLGRGINRGFENGRPGARIWKNRTDGYYFEISFSSKGYTNLVLSNGMSVSYNTYKNFDVEYSTDGQNYTKFGEYAGDLELKSGWTDGEFALPADADEQNRVYIRWKGVESSGLVGSATDYDGLCIGNIFVTADAGSLADEQAVLVVSNPENGATGITRNGSIILNFDKKIKAGTGKATLGDEQIEPIISGKSAIFRYSGLQYNISYTFSMPEGVLTSRSGNPVAAATITFTTMERQQPEARLYDAIVDANAESTVSDEGIPTFTTMQAAIDAAPTNRAKPWLIFVKNGQYKEHVDIMANKPYMHIIGQDRDKTVILNDAVSGGENAVHVDQGATVTVKADNIFFENITLENEVGHLLQTGPQALALNTAGDRIALNRVALLSMQDTWITTATSNNRHYIKNSVIEGGVDFIYNSGNVFFDGDTLDINRTSGGYIVAPSHALDVKWGYVFQNNVIRPHTGMNVTDVWLGRPWHGYPKTVFINTKTFVNLPAKGWYNTMGGLPVLWADYNTVDANGNAVDLSQREDTYYVIQYYQINENGDTIIASSRPSAEDMHNWTERKVYKKAKNYLTDEEAAQYTIKNVMGGDDNWQPDLMCEACNAPEPKLSDGNLTWKPVPYAICYVVTYNGTVVGFTTETEFTATESGTYAVQAVNEFGGLSDYGFADEVTTGLKTVQIVSPVSAIYSLEGKRLSSPRRGIILQRHEDGSVTKVLK